MAPAVVRRTPSGQHIRQVSRSLSSSLSSLKSRTIDPSEPSLVSAFAVLLSKGRYLSGRAVSVVSDALASSPHARAATGPLPLSKRQNAILAIPSTYKGLNSGPAPGAVVGIILGSIAGFILCLFILLYSFQFIGPGTVVEEEIITTTKRRRSRSRRSSHHTVMSERPPPPPAASPPRASSRRETIIVEETVRTAPPPREDEEIIVEEHSDDDIVEVIEDPSSIVTSHRTPTPPPQPKPKSRRSGYRTVDPAEMGGGDRPMRRVSRRERD